jgi:hypothetical protein
VDYYIHPYNSFSKFLILIWILPISNISALCHAGFQLNPMKHKIVIEIPPYYIDTLACPTNKNYHLSDFSLGSAKTWDDAEVTFSSTGCSKMKSKIRNYMLIHSAHYTNAYLLFHIVSQNDSQVSLL